MKSSIASSFPIPGYVRPMRDQCLLILPQKPKVQPVSPPLLHMSPVTLPFVPSSDTGNLELLSDHTSPTREEAREVERRIIDDDAFLSATREAEANSQDRSQTPLDPDNLGDLYSPLKGIADPPSSPQTPRRSLQDRKVDPPLSPPASEQLPPWKRKSVSWRESLTEVMHDIPLPIPKPENISSDDIDAFFEESIRPMGIKAERSIEQEQLQEVDTTLRVTVPIMDFSRPVAPWNANSQDMKANDKDLYKHNLSEMKTLHFSKHSWPISGKLHRELKWTAIPAALGKIEQENISDDGFLEDYLTLPDRVDVETLTWKPDGLRIFDELAESDEELLEGVFPEETDIESLVKKRKLELKFIEDDLPQHDVSLKAPRTEIPKENEEVHFRGPEIPFASFSALDALDSYMGVRKGHLEKSKLTAERYFPPVNTAAETDSLKQVAKPDIRATVAEHQPMPSPVVTVPTSTISFVASASFLSNRKLARQIQRLFPCAEFIERDFNLYLDPQPRPASKPNTCSETQTTMADEADISLSPSTGLIWTTLQKIKQRSLPGQVTRSAVQERISGAAPRYERLLVLVSEDCQTGDSLEAVADGTSRVDSRDCEVLIELTKFCLTLQSEIHVTFIAGGEDDLANWIVAMMVKYAVTDPDIKLIQDETLWEVFLRRAGMNAFASQAILGSLKAIDQDEGGGSAAVFGLTAFIKMSVRERFERFETMLGGRRMLGRVGRALDARW